jgi:hypothetical protein
MVLVDDGDGGNGGGDGSDGDGGGGGGGGGGDDRAGNILSTLLVSNAAVIMLVLVLAICISKVVKTCSVLPATSSCFCFISALSGDLGTTILQMKKQRCR